MMSSTADTKFLLGNLYKHKRLLLEMAKRDVFDRYAGNMFGAVWALVHPIMTIVVFIFMFAVVFRLKVETGIEFPGDHTLYMISGLVPWLVAADVLSRSSTIVSNHAALVKQVVFPVEILPAKMVLASLPTFLIGMVGLTIYALISNKYSFALLLYPLAALPFYIFLSGVAFLFAALGVFLRDLKEFTQMYILIGMYAVPIIYFMDWVPAKLRFFIYSNPITVFIETFHHAAYYGGISSWFVWLMALIISVTTYWFGAMIFARLRPYFGSYL